MFNSKKASRLRDFACLAFVISALMTGCGGGTTGNDNGSSGSTSSAATSSASTSLSVSASVTGWASRGNGTTGGASAPAANVYVVHNRAELIAALANQNSASYATSTTTAANEPKIIYIVGTIWGTDLGNGKFADEAYYKSQNSYAANWNFDLYVKSVDPSYTPTTDEKTAISKLSTAMSNLKRLQKAQIQFVIPSNTTILGVGSDAKIIDGYFSINATSNIIIRNLEFQAPQDLAPSYTNTVGSEEWNATYKAVSVVTGKQLWFDHCTFSDGAHIDSNEIRTINGVTKEVMRHDGLLDIEDSSDYITVSYSIFKNHDKTNMVGGSGDGNGAKERDYNHLTFSNNIWQDSVQRAPRARFGKVHVYNNYYTGNTDATSYGMSYYIGMGAESRILSEANVFDMTGSKADVSRVISNLNGYQFKDKGSWVNGVAASSELEAAAKAALEARWASASSAATKSGFTLAAYTNELGWTPDYSYTLASSAQQLREHNLANSGAGKLPVTAASSTRLMLDDSAAASYTVAKALTGSDAWAPQALNAGQPNAGRLYPASFTADYVVAKDGSGSYTTIQAALNAAAASTASRVYIQVKAGTYTEQLVVPASATTAITLYSTESSPSSVLVTSSLAQVSTAADYKALVGSTYETSVYYTSNTTEGKTVYNACSVKTGTIGKECSTTIRIRNNGFNAVNMSFVNAWGDTDASNNQALAAMVEKVDQVIFDNVRLASNQDTLYLANSGKRTYFAGGEITGDVDFIFGPGVGVFNGTTIRYTGARKPSGGFIAAPSTLATQSYGLVFNACVFLADDATTDDSVYLARQWDDGSGSVGKMIVRNSVLGRHVSVSNGPWRATTINNAAATYAFGGETYLGEYRNWDVTQPTSASTSSSASASSAASSTSSSSSAASSSSSSSSSSVATGSGSDSSISGSTTLTNAYVSSGLPVTVATSYDSTNGIYTLVSAGSMGGTTDTMQFAYHKIIGDFTLIARLTSLGTTGVPSTSNVRAGLMVRNSLADGSRYFGALMRGIPRLQWEQRKNDNETTSSSTMGYTVAPSSSAPLWLKLVRSGTSITVSYGTDGLTWSGAKTQDFSASGYTAFDSTVYVGLVGVSGSSTVTSTSTFDFVTITNSSSSSSSAASSASANLF